MSAHGAITDHASNMTKIRTHDNVHDVVALFQNDSLSANRADNVPFFIQTATICNNKRVRIDYCTRSRFRTISFYFQTLYCCFSAYSSPLLPRVFLCLSKYFAIKILSDAKYPIWTRQLILFHSPFLHKNG